MAKRLIIIDRCPLCGKRVKQVPDGILRQHPHKDDCEMIVTRTGFKQYIHSSCWYKMIEEKRPYYTKENQPYYKKTIPGVNAYFAKKYGLK